MEYISAQLQQNSLEINGGGLAVRRTGFSLPTSSPRAGKVAHKAALSVESQQDTHPAVCVTCVVTGDLGIEQAAFASKGFC